MPFTIPDNPNLRWLRNQAKRYLKAYRQKQELCVPVLKNLYRFAEMDEKRILADTLSLGEVQFALALQYGFKSWASLKQHVEKIENHGKMFQPDIPGVDPDFRDDESARALYGKMYETIENAASLEYTSEYRYYFKNKPIGAGSYKLWSLKPNFVKVVTTEHGTGKQGVLIGDGENCWIHWPSGKPRWDFDDDQQFERIVTNTYMKRPFPREKHHIDHMFWKIARWMGMSILDPSVFHRKSHEMDYFVGAMHHGQTSIDGDVCELIEASYMDHQRSKYLWLSAETHLPKLLRETVRVNAPIYIYEKWTDVKINHELPADMFTWSPPGDWHEYRIPAIEDGILKQGTPAPEFEFTLISGEKFRLSDQLGKVIWLVIWRVGCQPCRRELPELQSIRRKYSIDELTIVAVNVADDRENVLDFLAQNDITYPVIYDTSNAAHDMFYHKYQTVPGMSAVPMNYIIDRHGVVKSGFRLDDVANGEREVKELLSH
jgi:cytochrome c biogenesis protein CcmG, thiol:disulfide interchange protein DsbE